MAPTEIAIKMLYTLRRNFAWPSIAVATGRLPGFAGTAPLADFPLGAFEGSLCCGFDPGDGAELIGNLSSLECFRIVQPLGDRIRIGIAAMIGDDQLRQKPH